MKAQQLTLLALATCLSSSAAIKCFDCTFNSAAVGDSLDPRFDNSCDEDKDGIDSERLVTCEGGLDVCVTDYVILSDGTEVWDRYCGDSDNFNEEEDKCEKDTGFWGAEVRQCVCNENECNGASGLTSLSALSAALAAAVATARV